MFYTVAVMNYNSVILEVPDDLYGSQFHSREGGCSHWFAAVIHFLSLLGILVRGPARGQRLAAISASRTRCPAQELVETLRAECGGALKLPVGT